MPVQSLCPAWPFCAVLNWFPSAFVFWKALQHAHNGFEADNVNSFLNFFKVICKIYTVLFFPDPHNAKWAASIILLNIWWIKKLIWMCHWHFPTFLFLHFTFLIKQWSSRSHAVYCEYRHGLKALLPMMHRCDYIDVVWPLKLCCLKNSNYIQ